MAGRPQPGIGDAYSTPRTDTVWSPLYGNVTLTDEQKKSLTPGTKEYKAIKQGSRQGQSVIGGYIANEMLGIDDFSWALRNAQQGKWGEAAKSFGAGALELGTTVGSIGAGSVVKAGGKSIVKDVFKGTIRQAEKDAVASAVKSTGQKVADQFKKVGKRERLLDKLKDKSIKGPRYGEDGREPLTPPRPAYSSPTPTKPLPSSGGGTKTLEKTETRISNPKQDELEELYNLPSAKPDTNIVPKTTPGVNPRLTPGGVEKLSPSAVLRHAKTPALGLRPLGRLGNLVENVTDNSLSPQPEPKYQPDNKQRLNTRVDTENKRRGRVPGSMGTAAADVTIPYAY
jgi:hypothetical protein